ncbi:hypothetical protein SESBI_16206 [Sesbania bispinosa]|nr:hypothetical protein SESBI_16206 [Sesbania bispinosa]
MENLTTASSEEKDLRDRCTKKVKMNDSNEVPIAIDYEKPDPSPNPIPKDKPSYKDIVIA